ncbi:MAG: hypothetical protein CMN44_09865 [SAR116 cluster bacterium]|nr:hypothetical protein [SAR116 cluster bacterium]RPH08120.1 MAG: hypothetical protein CBC14_009730 [Alphaproteobacteria bacterium TMED54]
MNEIKKEIRLFKLIEKLKKRDLYKQINNINLLNEEIKKTDDLLDKINYIINENSQKTDEQDLLGANFKNKSKIINVMSNQKSIANNKKDYLLEQKYNSDLELANTLLQKDKVKEKIQNKVSQYHTFKELKSQPTTRNLKKY